VGDRGLHPHDAKLGLDGLAELLGEPGVVAVGECGLDYHYDHSPRETQRSRSRRRSAGPTSVAWC
jgi:TatD DNase family protein